MLFITPSSFKAVLVGVLLAFSSVGMVAALNCKCQLVPKEQSMVAHPSHASALRTSPDCLVLQSKLEYERHQIERWGIHADIIKHSVSIDSTSYDDPSDYAHDLAKIHAAVKNSDSTIKCFDQGLLDTAPLMYAEAFELLTYTFAFTVVFLLSITFTHLIYFFLRSVNLERVLALQKSPNNDLEKGGMLISLDCESDSDDDLGERLM